MKSVSGKNWEEIRINQRLIDKNKYEYQLNDIQAKLVISRNFSKSELYTIKNRLNLTNPFFKYEDFIIASKLLKKHIDKKNKILIIGDYDVDGCVSTSLMVEFLQKLKIKPDYYIPDRFKDGYGASKNLIKKLVTKKNYKLIFFLDCGTNSHSSIKFLKEQKIDTIIIDHHNANKPYPISNIFINPKKETTYDKYNYLCSSYLTYLFIDLYFNIYKIKSSLKNKLIYVLLATVSDIMPIRGLNRLLAISVLREFDLNKEFIFEKIFKKLNISKKLEIDDLGFIIGPILNSAGRINNANQVVKLLISKSNEEKEIILEKLFNFNKKRKDIEQKILNDIDLNEIEKKDGIIVIYLPNISEGLIGIIASKIKDYFNKPCIVLTNSLNIIKGSARSTSEFNIGNYIYIALKKKILISGGGHNLAAGISLNKDNINLFENFLNVFYKNKSQQISNFYLSKISLNYLNKKFIKDLNIIGPFGHKNSNPIFLIENVKLVNPTILKNRFISCFIKNNTKMIKAISFNQLKSRVSYEILNSKNSMNVFVKLKENILKNNRGIQVEIIDVIKTTINT